MRRVELVLLAFFLACWLVGILGLLEIVPLAGNLSLGLYPLYSVAAALGWLFGNVYVTRTSRTPSRSRGPLFALYLLCPQGVVYLLRAMAPASVQAAAPLVPLYSFGVYTVLFFVPLTLRSGPRRDLKIGKRRDDR